MNKIVELNQNEVASVSGGGMISDAASWVWDNKWALTAGATIGYAVGNPAGVYYLASYAVSSVPTVASGIYAATAATLAFGYEKGKAVLSAVGTAGYKLFTGQYFKFQNPIEITSAPEQT